MSLFDGYVNPDGMTPNQYGDGQQNFGMNMGMEGCMPPQTGFMQPPIDMGYMQQPMDIGYMQQPYGIQQPKVSRGQAVEWLRQYLQSATGVFVSKEEKIDEVPNKLRHACANVGNVSYLDKNIFTLCTGNAIPYYFCKACGKLYYYKDFM